MDWSPTGPSVHGILQARTLEWVTIPFSRGYSWPKDRTWVSCMADGFFTTEPPGKQVANSLDSASKDLLAWMPFSYTPPLVSQNRRAEGGVLWIPRGPCAASEWNEKFHRIMFPKWLHSAGSVLWFPEALQKKKVFYKPIPIFKIFMPLITTIKFIYN